MLVRRGEKAVFNRSKNDEKECVTAFLGGSAAGLPTPPMLIHAFKRMPANILNSNPKKWSVRISDSGWQTQVTFFDYLTNIFYNFLLEEKVKLPIILFIDGHKSHVSLDLSEFCASHQIELIALYPNSTHITQPMDVGVFKPLNSSWVKKAKEWRVGEEYAKIQRKDVGPILKTAIEAIDYSDLLKEAFRKFGLHPFTVDNIDFSRILPSVGDEEDSQEQLWNETSASSISSSVTEDADRSRCSIASFIFFDVIVGYKISKYLLVPLLLKCFVRQVLFGLANQNTCSYLQFGKKCMQLLPVAMFQQ